jgi:transposase InsO family protein
MSKARLVITAVVVEKRSQSEVARSYGVSQPWISRLVARYRAEGEAAFEPRSRRPNSSPSATPPDVVDLVLRLRKDLEATGLDAGAHTICWHLHEQHGVAVSVATVWRICTRAGLVIPEPKKRPKSSYLRFQAELPNQMWQSDFTHWKLTCRGGQHVEVEVLNILDDHSRYLIAAVATTRVTGPLVAATFQDAFNQHGTPASVLTDNGMVFTTRFAGGRRGRHSRNGLETLLAEHCVEQKNSSPNHPQTCGKVERFHQTEKKWLAAQPTARTLAQLQQQLDALRDYYNTRRPHRALGRSRSATPAAAYAARPKATPSTAYTPPTHERVRHDRIDDSGVVTLRYNGRLHHIGIGRTHARTYVLLLIQDRDIRVINQHTGELLRELTLDPSRDYQPLGRPPGPSKHKPRTQ